jgi:hypothetical protein
MGTSTGLIHQGGEYPSTAASKAAEKAASSAQATMKASEDAMEAAWEAREATEEIDWLLEEMNSPDRGVHWG